MEVRYGAQGNRIAHKLLTSTLCGTALNPALESTLHQMFLAISASTFSPVSRSGLTWTTTVVSSTLELSLTAKVQAVFSTIVNVLVQLVSISYLSLSLHLDHEQWWLLNSVITLNLGTEISHMQVSD